MAVLTAALMQLVPISELAPGQTGAIRTQLISRMCAEACSKLNMTQDKLVVRDIRPNGDLDYTYEDWWETTGAADDVYETMSTGTMGDQRWVGIYGIKDDSEMGMSCTAIKFNVGGADRVIWTLQALNEEDGMVGICPSGIIIPQNAPYTISRYVRSRNAATHLVLKGFVVEPRGRVLSP